MQEIREEQPSDYRESENVLREAFWNVASAPLHQQRY